jgi:hypothetical protein
MPQSLQLTQTNGGALLICRQKHTLLHANPSNVLLKVAKVLQVRAVSGSLPMTYPDHGSDGSMGIITLASHTLMPWAMDSWKW